MDGSRKEPHPIEFISQPRSYYSLREDGEFFPLTARGVRGSQKGLGCFSGPHYIHTSSWAGHEKKSPLPTLPPGNGPHPSRSLCAKQAPCNHSSIGAPRTASGIWEPAQAAGRADSRRHGRAQFLDGTGAIAACTPMVGIDGPLRLARRRPVVRDRGHARARAMRYKFGMTKVACEPRSSS